MTYVNGKPWFWDDLDHHPFNLARCFIDPGFVLTMGIAAHALCQGRDGGDEAAESFANQVGVEVNVPVEGHEGQEENGGRAVHQGEEKDQEEKGQAVGGSKDLGLAAPEPGEQEPRGGADHQQDEDAHFFRHFAPGDPS